MNRTVIQIREINKIEKELTDSSAGVLAVHTLNNEMVQLPGAFLYHNKNIYVTLRENDDLFEEIDYESEVSFAVLRVDSSKSRRKKGVQLKMKITAVTLNGYLKRPEDVVVTKEIKDLFNVKYTGRKYSENAENKLVYLMLDTSEIKAFEEVI